MKRLSIRATLILLTTLVIITITLNAALAVIWSDEYRLTWLGYFDGLPAIAQMDDGRIWVLWETDALGDTDIAYIIYDGVSWTDPDLLFSHSSNDIHPAIFQAENGTICVFWSSDRNENNYNIFCTTSSDNGLSWSDAVPLTTSLNEDNAASAAQKTDGTIWLVWQRKLTPSNYDLFFRIYDGSTWSDEEPLVTDSSQDQVPAIANAMDGKMWVTWCSYRTGDFEIYYRIHDGTSWSDDEFRLTYSSNADVEPSIVQARDGAIWIVWTSSEPQPSATDDLYYQTSTNDGATWSGTLPLTSANYDNMWSSITQLNNKTLCVAFTSNRDDNYDIYNKVSSEILFHDVAITDVTPSPTVVDPGEIVSIDVVAENQGDFAENFDVTCYVDSTSIGSEAVFLDAQSSTTLSFLWDTTTYAVGEHTISANASTVEGETSVNTQDNAYEDGTVMIAGHDLAMISLSTSEPSVAQGYILKIYARVKNKGTVPETFNVIAYYDSTTIETQTVEDLDAGAYTDLTFNWDTTDVPYGDYVISATAEPVPGETETGDNSMTDGTVTVIIPGDVDGNGTVEIVDLMLIARALGTDPSYPPGTDWDQWNPNCDINNDLKVDAYDMLIAGKNYGETVG